MLDARVDRRKALGRFAETDPNYDYSSGQPEPVKASPPPPAPFPKAPSPSEDDRLMREQGGRGRENRWRNGGERQ